MSFLLTLKSKLLALGGFILAVLTVVLRMNMLKDQRDKAREKAKIAQAQAVAAKKTLQEDEKIDQQVDEQRKKSNEAIDNGEMPDNIRNRNDF